MTLKTLTPHDSWQPSDVPAIGERVRVLETGLEGTVYRTAGAFSFVRYKTRTGSRGYLPADLQRLEVPQPQYETSVDEVS